MVMTFSASCLAWKAKERGGNGAMSAPATCQHWLRDNAPADPSQSSRLSLTAPFPYMAAAMDEMVPSSIAGARFDGRGSTMASTPPTAAIAACTAENAIGVMPSQGPSQTGLGAGCSRASYQAIT